MLVQIAKPYIHSKLFYPDKLRTIFLLCLLYSAGLFGQNTGKNLDFKMGNFTNWVGYTWRYSLLVPSINTNPAPGIVQRRQTIMSDTSAYDKNTGYSLRKIPKGYLYSARIGDEIINTDGSPRCWQQSLRYTMKIDSSNALLSCGSHLFCSMPAIIMPLMNPGSSLPFMTATEMFYPIAQTMTSTLPIKLLRDFRLTMPPEQEILLCGGTGQPLGQIL